MTFSDGIGDTLMSLPALRVLRPLFGGPVTFACATTVHGIIGAEFPADKIISRQELWSYRHLDANCWLSLDPGEDEKFSFEVLRNLQLTWSLGWDSRHTHRVRPENSLAFCDEVFRAAKFLCPDANLITTSFGPKLSQGKCKLALDLRSLLPPGTKVVAVHPKTGPVQKNWPARSFYGLIKCLLRESETLWFFILGVESFDTKLEALDRVIPCANIALASAFAIIEAADLLIGVDSGLLHAADLYRTPAVGIFGPSSPERWGCRFTKHRHIRAPSRLISDVSVEEVSYAVKDVLSLL